MIICLKCISEKCVLFTVNINVCLKVSLSTRGAFGEQLGTWALIIYYYFFYSHQKKFFSKSYLEGTWGFGGRLGRHSKGTWGTETLGPLGYTGTWPLRALRHLGARTLKALRHSGTWALEALCFSRPIIKLFLQIETWCQLTSKTYWHVVFSWIFRNRHWNDIRKNTQYQDISCIFT